MSGAVFGSYSISEGQLCLNTKSGARVSVSDLVGDYERPVYLYNLDDIFSRVHHMRDSFGGKSHIHFALKCNDHPYLLKRLAKEGLGVDIVSGGELKKALEAGFAARDVVFSGVGKTKSELVEAMKAGVGQINVESPHELERIGRLAKANNLKAKVAFRLNPDVNPVTHPYITTGFRENKFGMDSGFFDELGDILNQNKAFLELVGVTVHIGSQLRDLSASIESVEKALGSFKRWQGKGFPMRTLDIGGGIGIDYNSLDAASEFEMLTEYGREVLRIIEGEALELHSEPGRILVGRSGILITQVQYLKNSPDKNFCIVDTGMHHLMRPALYQAKHQIIPLKRQETSTERTYDIVGPICESSDVLGHDRRLGELAEDDLLAIMDAGAYGRVMMNNYNSHRLPLEVFVEDGEVVFSG